MIFRELLLLQNSCESSVRQFNNKHIVAHFYYWSCNNTVPFKCVRGLTSYFIKDITTAHFFCLLKLMLKWNCELIFDKLNNLKVIFRTILLLLLKSPLFKFKVVKLLRIFHQVSNNLMLSHILAILI